MDRRAFLAAGSLAAAAGALSASPGANASASANTRLFTRVDFNHDGLGLDPHEYTHLLEEAVQGDALTPDYYSLGGFVEALETDFAKRLGKEVAIFVPTGTLANHLAVRRLAGDDRRVLVQADSHLFNDSGDCAEVLSGLNLVPLGEGRATLTLDEIEAWVERSATGRVENRVGVIVIEDPVRRHGHEFVDPAELARISRFARDHGIRLHLDGARMFNLPQHTGRSVVEHAALFDTVYVSLWKHFNAATGAILAGSREHLEGLFHERRRFGGALPAAWPSLAPVPRFLPTYEADYARAWTIADALFRRLEATGRFRIARPPRGTSRVLMNVLDLDAARLVERLAVEGIRLGLPPEGENTFTLQINTTLLRRSPDALVDAFLRAAG
ncbi:MAG: threonine aldolase family protein [Pseudomonadota bacterium]|jgi:threonine aldolase|uniref:threonine aldolase family protein n=1 Tax=Silanimonas sp. TaxID=1929290 RepID=UPI0022BD42D1|nr:beta-eliminating lyase-related protein [Silanimonas sp.]MCZ8063194.1 beta-eliminating lyase-related protein [Silanimonas sp.]MCZ8113741.1 beta-eliminating lyase-related protein [Silanimonas sp.]